LAAGILDVFLVQKPLSSRSALRELSLIVPKNLLRDLLDATNDETLPKLAGKFGAEHPNEVIHFWFKRINLETLLGYIRIHSEYCNLGQVEIENDETTQSAFIMITVRHGQNIWNDFSTICGELT